MKKSTFLLLALTALLNSCSSQEAKNAGTVAVKTSHTPPAHKPSNAAGSFKGTMNGIALECTPEETYKGAFMNRVTKEHSKYPIIVKSFRFKGGWGLLLDIPYGDGHPGTSDDLSISGEIPGDVIFAKKGGHQTVKTTKIVWATDSSEFYYSGEFSAELCDMTGKTNYAVKGSIENLAVHVPSRMIKEVFRTMGETAKERAKKE